MAGNFVTELLDSQLKLKAHAHAKNKDSEISTGTTLFEVDELESIISLIILQGKDIIKQNNDIKIYTQHSKF